jgi:hypothetical protein
MSSLWTHQPIIYFLDKLRSSSFKSKDIGSKNSIVTHLFIYGSSTHYWLVRLVCQKTFDAKSKQNFVSNNCYQQQNMPISSPISFKLLDQLSHVKVFTKVDLHGVYSRRCWMEDQFWNLLWPLWIHGDAFWPYQCSCHFSTFDEQCFILIFGWLHGFYINDIPIFSKNMEEHGQHVRLVLDKLWKVGFYVKLERCKFHETEVKFLGYIIYEDGVHMDLYKVQTIVNLVNPTFVCDVQCFQCSTPYSI